MTLENEMQFIQIIGFILSMLFTSNASSEIPYQWHYHDWGKAVEKNTAESIGSYSNQEGKISSLTLVAKISLSKDNKQRIYFNVADAYDGVTMDSCHKSEFTFLENNYIKKGVWKIDGRNVEMLLHCDGTDSSTLYATPANEQGAQYTVERFKKSRKTVLISDGHFEVKMSAMGFTKTWNSFGGDAL